MEEYEVDLRDYLRVLWQGKWIVLAAFLAAMGAAAAVSFKAPDVFRADARLMLEAPPGLPFSYVPPSPDVVVEWARDPDLLAQALAAAGDGGITSGWMSSHMQTEAEGEFVDISLEGPVEPDRLRGLLQGVVTALMSRGGEDVKQAAEAKLSSLPSRREELLRRRAVWEEKLNQARAQAQGQRQEILARIAELAGEPGVRDVSLGDKITLEGYRLQKELDLLYARLQAVELELDGLSRLGVYALPGGAGKYATLEEDLAAIEAEESTLSSLISSPPSPVVVVRGPVAGSSPVGPNRGMNLAVAGVLGLFVGILLAFFWHWLREPAAGGGREASRGS